ncbi:hypothetical protein [Luteibacter sp. 3190]|uniref:hypothetical protein n=1 Tax=Luteibacter sp. 3190 TaxID=2817736 RepID=UPI002859B63F|nr:hypothetical protein [Luteibacter sp. 3190]MDR6935349.1 hypothetical protein [Luteibacter sp. 3190]
MMTWLGLLAGGGALVVALCRRSPRPRAELARPTPTQVARPDWRSARTETNTLTIAVDAMAHHTSMLQQLSDAWLLSANLWESDPAAFRRKVQHAREMALALEDECRQVVEELRALERLRDGAAAFEVQRIQATTLAEQAEAATAALRAQVNRLAEARGLDPRAPFDARASSVPTIDAARVTRLMPLAADGRMISLAELLG